MAITVLIAGASSRSIKIWADPIAELGSLLHAVTNGDHHPRSRYLRERIHEDDDGPLLAQANRFGPLYGAIRARFLMPLRIPTDHAVELRDEIDDVTTLDPNDFVTMCAESLINQARDIDYTTLLDSAEDRHRFLERVSRISISRVELARDLLRDPRAIQDDLRDFLLIAADRWFAADWEEHRESLLADVQRRRTEISQLGPAALAGLLPTARLRHDPDRVVFDKVNSDVLSIGRGQLVLVPSFHCSPHLIVKRHRGYAHLVQYEVQAVYHDTLDALERRISALDDHVRIQICRHILRHPRTTSDIAIRLGVTQPQASRHLRILREAALVTQQRVGRVVYYSLDVNAFRMLGSEVLAALHR